MCCTPRCFHWWACWATLPQRLDFLLDFFWRTKMKNLGQSTLYRLGPLPAPSWETRRKLTQRFCCRLYCREGGKERKQFWNGPQWFIPIYLLACSSFLPFLTIRSGRGRRIQSRRQEKNSGGLIIGFKDIETCGSTAISSIIFYTKVQPATDRPTGQQNQKNCQRA